MSPMPDTDTSPGLKLFALQHQGQPQDFVWKWQGPFIKTGFDNVFAAMGVTDVQLLAHARYCTLERMGSTAQPVWLLGNSSHEMVCSVNQRVLSAGSQMRLTHGDSIELGLTRFVVSMDASGAMPALEDAAHDDGAALGLMHHDATTNASAAAKAAEDSAFRLTDLDALADVTNLPENERYGVNRADFSDLISFTPEETIVTPAATVAAPVAPAEPSLQEALDAVNQPSYQDKVSDLLAQFANGEDQAQKAQVPQEADPFEALHAQYLYKLRNPSHSDDALDWQDRVQGGQAKQPDPLGFWQDAADRTKKGLDDLLGQSQKIDVVLHALDPLGNSDVLKPEPYDSVMHLFAPENLRIETDDTLEALVQRSLPGLTRREHHSLSLDSAMPFTGGEDQLPKSTKP
jgi:hypothetical protein